MSLTIRSGKYIFLQRKRTNVLNSMLLNSHDIIYYRKYSKGGNFSERATGFTCYGFIM